ncbi:MAG: response regulator [Oscillatoria sp. PMC 1068.18]|nr:response regulator [Oscillatoria sp. PMC 1076.18]MEC4990432.1 response regulator [Oscillatoria sp. PMC 1068.18]
MKQKQNLSQLEKIYPTFQDVLKKGCSVMGWDYGEAWIKDPEGKALVCSPVWYCQEELKPELEKFHRKSLAFSFPLGIGLPGRVWLSEKPEWEENVSSLPQGFYLRAREAAEARIKTAFGIPVLVKQTVVAVLVFYSRFFRDKHEKSTEWISAFLNLEFQLKEVDFAAAKTEPEIYFRSLVENNNEALMIIDTEGNVLYNNSTLESWFGYQQQALLGKSLFEYVEPDEIDAVINFLTTLIQNPERVQNGEFRFRSQDNSWREVIIIGKILKNSSGIEQIVLSIQPRSMLPITASKSQFLDLIRSLEENDQKSETQLLKEKLLTNEAQMRVVLEAMTDIVLVLNVEQLTFEIMPTNYAILYEATEDIISETCNLFYNETEKFLAPAKKALLTQETVSFEYSLYVEAKELWFSARINPLGKDTVIWVARDISDRQQANLIVAEQENTLRLFIEHTPAALAMFDNQMRYIVASRRWQEDYKLKDTELIGHSHYEIFPEIPDRWKQIHANCLKGEVARCEEDYFPRADGSVDWIRWEIHPWRSRTGNIGGIIMFTEVITERKQAQLQLQSLNSQLQAILNAATEVAIIATDTQGLITVFNPGAEKMLGYTTAEMVGKHTPALFHLESEVVQRGAELTQQFQRPISGFDVFVEKARQGGYDNREWTYITKEGNSLTVNLAVTAIQNSEGEISGFLGIASDFTPRIAAELELKAAESAMRSLSKLASETHLDFDQRLQKLLSLGREEFKLEIGIISEIEANRYQAIATQLPTQFPFPIHPGTTFELKTTFCANAIASAEPICISEAGKSPEWSQHPAYQSFFRLEAYLGTRVMVGEKSYGTLSFASPTPAAQNFTPSQIQLLVLMGQWLGGEIERQQARTALENQIRQALLLGKLTKEIRSTLKTEEIFATAAKLIGETFAVSRCLIHSYVRQPKPKLALMTQYLTPGCKSVETLEISLADNPCIEVVLAADRALANPDFSCLPLLEPQTESCYQLESMLVVRTSYQNKPNGVIALHQCDHFREWTTEEINLLEAVAEQLGIAIAQAGYLEREQQYTQKLKTENVQLEKVTQEAIAADRAKSEFLAMMSHEIRTPMNAIVGMTGLLLDTHLNKDQQDFVETVRDSSDSLLTIINDILDFSKIESGKLELEEQPFNLRHCIESSLDLVAASAGAKSLELAYFLAPETPENLSGDVTRLRQILVNLLSNAVKFTQVGEVIVSVSATLISSSIPKYELKIAVKDTGIGIPEDRLERLFKPFSQVDASMTREYGGTGLGLVIAKRLSEAMGGTMWVESELGVGSCFAFTIIAAKTEKLTNASVNTLPTELQNKRLLVVDDNATNRRIIKLQVKTWGMNVVAVESAASALKLLAKNEQFDLAILDFQMPVMDGVTLAKEIRALPAYQQLPLIILSSAGKLVSQQITDISVAAFLSKPIKQAQLYQLLVSIFSQKSVVVSAVNTREPIAESELAQKLPLRILLVEDVAVNQKVALLSLQRLGYRADVANNGLEALEALRRQSYDVVFMDVQMPQMDGLEATRRICAKMSLEDRPWIIAMTAHAMRGDREECLEVGMNDYISKPVRNEALVEALLRYQEKHNLPNAQTLPKKQSSPNLDSEIPPETSLLKQSSPNLDSEIPTETSLKTTNSPSRNLLDVDALDRQILAGLKALDDTENMSFLVDIIDSYLEDAPQRLDAIATAITANNPVELHKSAHALKSLSVTIGAKSLSRIASEIEAIARLGKTTNCQNLLEQLYLEYQRVVSALQLEHPQRQND